MPPKGKQKRRKAAAQERSKAQERSALEASADAGNPDGADEIEHAASGDATEEQIRAAQARFNRSPYGFEDFSRFADQPGMVSERKHYLDVIYSMLNYKQDSENFVEQHLLSLYSGLSSAERRVLDRVALRIHSSGETHGSSPSNGDWVARELTAVRPLLQHNQNFIETVLDCREDLAPGFTQWGVPEAHDVNEGNMSRCRLTIKQLVRDWSVEGEVERARCYQPMLDALEKYLPLSEPMLSGQAPPWRVLCPGSGAGRLPFEVTRRGYSCTGNEFSYHMLVVSDFMLNMTQTRNEYSVFPYALLSDARRTCDADRFREIRIPDVCPNEELVHGSSAGPTARARSPLCEFSMASGEFVEIFSEHPQEWHGMLTCFFVDTARNIFIYVREIARAMPARGVWINLGPLLYHFAEQPNEFSIELSWEEVRPAILRYFDFVEEEAPRKADCEYARNLATSKSTNYSCIWFVCRRNDVPVEGTSTPVYDN